MAEQNPRMVMPPPMPGARFSIWGRALDFCNRPRFLAFVVFFAASGALLLLRWQTVRLESLTLLPSCILHTATGWHCPGCGITRSLAALLRGDWWAAFGHNAVGLAVLGIAGLLLLRPWWIAARHNRWQPPALPRSTGWWLLGLALVYGVLRNLPWAPFTLLAP